MKYVVHVKAHGVYSADVLESNTEKSYYYVESLACLPVVSHHLKVNVLFVVFF